MLSYDDILLDELSLHRCTCDFARNESLLLYSDLLGTNLLLYLEC